MIVEIEEDKLDDRLGASLVPFEGHLHLTEACNLSCRHCFRRGIAAGEELTGPEWIEILSDARDLGCLHLTISGGEPLMHPDFWTIFEALSGMRFAITLFSNGTLIGPREADLLSGGMLEEADISIHGAGPETHDGFTGMAGSFERSLGAVRLLAGRGVKTIVKMSVVRSNLEEVPRLGKMVSGIGAIFAPDYLIIPPYSGIPLTGFERLRDEEIRLFEDHFEAWTGRPRAPRRDFEDHPEFCNMGWTRFAIGPDGSFFPCVQVRESVGSLSRYSFRDIWYSSPRLNALRKNTGMPIEECLSCDLRTSCRNRCMGHFEDETGRYDLPAPERCRITRVLASGGRETGERAGR